MGAAMRLALLCAAVEPAELPMLAALYAKSGTWPVDLQPSFTPDCFHYEVVLDWKMHAVSFFPLESPPGVIDNIHLCPQDGNCATKNQKVATMDVSLPISLTGGQVVVFELDVLLNGRLSTYVVHVRRQTGTEVTLSRLALVRPLSAPSGLSAAALGSSVKGPNGAVLEKPLLTPPFSPGKHHYNGTLAVEDELAIFEVQFEDSAQTLWATAELEVHAVSADDPTGSTLGRRLDAELGDPAGLALVDPAGLPGRRLGVGRTSGEEQYPFRRVEFPLPLGGTRRVNLRVTSADGGHFGWYTFLLSRPRCPHGDLFDSDQRTCVHFCKRGFFADATWGRCALCRPGCGACTEYDKCMECYPNTRVDRWTLNAGGRTCTWHPAPFWQAHPQRTVMGALGAVALAVLACGLAAFFSRGKVPATRKRGIRAEAANTALPRERQGLTDRDADAKSDSDDDRSVVSLA